MIAARSLGYGTGFYTTYFPEARMRRVSRHSRPLQSRLLHPDRRSVEWPPAPPKKPLEEFVVFEKF